MRPHTAESSEYKMGFTLPMWPQSCYLGCEFGFGQSICRLDHVRHAIHLLEEAQDQTEPLHALPDCRPPGSNHIDKKSGCRLLLGGGETLRRVLGISHGNAPEVDGMQAPATGVSRLRPQKSAVDENDDLLGHRMSYRNLAI